VSPALSGALRRRLAPGLTAVLCLVAAAGVLTYRGPGWVWVRGFVGDVLVVVFGVALLALGPVGRWPHRVAAMASIAVGAELLQLLQLVGPDAHWFWHLTLGSTFDPVDLLAYGVGLVIAAGLERAWAPRLQPSTAADI